MFYFFFKREFLPTTVLLLIFGVFLYFIDCISEFIISGLVEESFTYEQNPFLKLVYLLLLVVTIGFFSALSRNENIDNYRMKISALSFLVLTIIGMLIGWGIHIYAVVSTISAEESMMALEDNIFFYYCTDFFLMGAYIFAAFKFLRPAIHQK